MLDKVTYTYTHVNVKVYIVKVIKVVVSDLQLENKEQFTHLKKKRHTFYSLKV